MSNLVGVARALRLHLSGGDHCPLPGSIGECAAIDLRTITQGYMIYEASVYIWRDDFNPMTLAHWLHEAGATDVRIAHVLEDDVNGDRAGRTIDGARAWDVTFSLLDERIVKNARRA